jgi:hypothetical protein
MGRLREIAFSAAALANRIALELAPRLAEAQHLPIILATAEKNL